MWSCSKSPLCSGIQLLIADGKQLHRLRGSTNRRENSSRRRSDPQHRRLLRRNSRESGASVLRAAHSGFVRQVAQVLLSDIRRGDASSAGSRTPSNRKFQLLWTDQERKKKKTMSKPNYTGTYHMVEQENMDAYLSALDINIALRKIVCLLKPTKDITHDPSSGDMKIRTITTFKNFNMDFTIGKEFTEDLGAVDGRTCQTTVNWDGDKLVCVQRGEKEGRGWTHWLEGDKLHLEMRVKDIIAKQVFKKAN